MEDETMGGSFQTSPPRSTQAPPEESEYTRESELKHTNSIQGGVRQAGRGKNIGEVILTKAKEKESLLMTVSDKEEDAEQRCGSYYQVAQKASCYSYC
ncbi:hypothetical protein Tco_1145047 [Tanacetum coccineum]